MMILSQEACRFGIDVRTSEEGSVNDICRIKSLQAFVCCFVEDLFTGSCKEVFYWFSDSFVCEMRKEENRHGKET